MKLGKIGAAIMSAALFASPTLAADTAVTPLPAGQAAGTKQADLLGLATFPLLVIGAAVVVGIVAASGGFDSSKSSNSTTGTTS